MVTNPTRRERADLNLDRIITGESDTYRHGDPDFDWKRDRFYDMVRRHLAYVETRAKKGKGKAKSNEPGRDGRKAPESYGSPAKLMLRNPQPDAVEVLRFQAKLLNSHFPPPMTDAKRDIAFVEGEVRRDTLETLETLFYGAELTPLRSVDPSAVPSGGFGPRSISDHKLDCQRRVQDMRKEIPPACMSTIERVIAGEMIWEVPSRKARKILLQDLRMALDFATWSLSITKRGKAQVSKDDLRSRWELADEFFRQVILRPAMHDGRVIR